MSIAKKSIQADAKSAQGKQYTDRLDLLEEASLKLSIAKSLNRIMTFCRDNDMVSRLEFQEIGLHLDTLIDDARYIINGKEVRS